MATSRVKALVRPELLVWARESAGFLVSEAATKLKVDEEKLASWENGKDAPSIPQLRKMAELYKRPLAVFYLQEVPKKFQPMRDLRRLPGIGLPRLPPSLVLEQRRASQRRELALELMDDLGDKPASFTLVARLGEDPEAVASRIRDAIGVVNQKPVKDKGLSLFRKWRSKIEDAGVLVFQATNFVENEVSGFALFHEKLPLIVVSQKDSYTRRSFSLLHEFVHLMLRTSGVSDLDVDDSRPPEDQAIEIFCNQVAAATLIPKDLLLSEGIVANHDRHSETWTDDEIANLSQKFGGVSREAVLRRLLTFGRTTDVFYRKKRMQYQAQFTKMRQEQKEKMSIKEGGMARNMPRETIGNLGEPLVRMVLGSYYQDRLTLSDVAGYLGVKTKHIPKIVQAAGFL